MQKLNTYALVLLLACAFLTGCRQSDESYRVNNNKQLILRLAETQSFNYPSTQGANEFARLVAEKSLGRIRVKVYDSGRLGDENSVVEQVQFGGIDLARVSLASLAKYSQSARLLTLPYLFRSSEHMWNVMNGPLGSEIAEDLRKEKISWLSWYEGGAKGFYNSKRSIDTIDGLRGLKVSVQRSPLIMNVYSEMGISLVPMQACEVYSSLQTGVIDGVEENIVAYYTSRQFEVAPYFLYDDHSRIPEVLIGSRVALMQLTKNDQMILEQAAKESAVLQEKAWLDMKKEAMEALNSKGVRITYAVNQSKELLLSTAKPYYSSFPPQQLTLIRQTP